LAVADAAFLEKFESLPVRTFRAHSLGRVYIVSKSSIVGGRGGKLVAEALDGSDYISFNIYRLKAQTELFPCEMSSAKVTLFVLGIDPASVRLQSV